MPKRTYTVQVVQQVEVTLDDEKFDDKFMEEFRDSFYHFMTLDDHASHIAQLAGRGIIPESSEFKGAFFIEGYGLHTEMGLAWKVTDTDFEVLEERRA